MEADKSDPVYDFLRTLNMTTPIALTPAELISTIEQVFNSGVIPTPEEAQKLKDLIAKLTNPGRGSTLDFSDPANSGLIAAISA